jgi:hypothetical protein
VANFSWPSDAVMDVHHAFLKTAHIQQFEFQANIFGESPFSASHHHGGQEQAALVDQLRYERVGSQVGTSNWPFTPPQK